MKAIQRLTSESAHRGREREVEAMSRASKGRHGVGGPQMQKVNAGRSIAIVPGPSDSMTNQRTQSHRRFHAAPPQSATYRPNEKFPAQTPQQLPSFAARCQR